MSTPVNGGLARTQKVACPHPSCQAFLGHVPNCPLQSDEERREQFARYLEHFERRLQILQKALQRQRELTGTWHAKYVQVNHENNTLRRKLGSQPPPERQQEAEPKRDQEHPFPTAAMRPQARSGPAEAGE